MEANSSGLCVSFVSVAYVPVAIVVAIALLPHLLLLLIFLQLRPCSVSRHETSPRLRGISCS